MTGTSLALLVLVNEEQSRYGNDLSVWFRPMTAGKKGPGFALVSRGETFHQ